MLCDLHTHSTFSDGTFTPTELIAAAKKLNIAIALTDHNTTAGLQEFISAATKDGVEYAPGVEISTVHQSFEIHILALFVPVEHFETVEEFCKSQNKGKEESNALLLANLQNAGYEITMDDVLLHGKEGNINRANFAACLVHKGYFNTVNEAFDSVLHERFGLYVSGFKPQSIDTIEFIRSINAVPVWAHPLDSVKNYEMTDEFAKEFKRHGLAAMETMYSLYSEEDNIEAQNIAQKNELLPSGGSDFHGANKPDISLMTGKGNLKIPYEYYSQIKCLSMYS